MEKPVMLHPVVEMKNTRAEEIAREIYRLEAVLKQLKDELVRLVAL